MTRRTTRGALLAVLGTLFAGTAALAAPASAAELSITPAPSAGLTNGQTISVSGNAGTANAPRLFVAVCETTPTATNCDQDLTGIGTPTAHIAQVTPDPRTGAWGPIDFHLRSTIVTADSPDGFDCLSSSTCVIGSTNAANPKDRTYNVTSPLTFGASAPTPTTPAAGSTASDDDGSSPLVPIGIAVLAVALVGGLILIVTKRRSGAAA